jgi:hypothetical protein
MMTTNDYVDDVDQPVIRISCCVSEILSYKLGDLELLSERQ